MSTACWDGLCDCDEMGHPCIGRMITRREFLDGGRNTSNVDDYDTDRALFAAGLMGSDD